MVFPVPADAPVIPVPPETVQLRVALGSVEEIFITADSPLHILVVEELAVISLQINL